MACPAERALDLRGNLRVWLEVKNRTLVAHGWGGQRIEIPVSKIGLVRTGGDYQIDGIKRGEALLVLDRYDHVLLRAPGNWPTFGDRRDMCRAAGLPEPAHLAKYKMMWTVPARVGPEILRRRAHERVHAQPAPPVPVVPVPGPVRVELPEGRELPAAADLAARPGSAPNAAGPADRGGSPRLRVPRHGARHGAAGLVRRGADPARDRGR